MNPMYLFRGEAPVRGVRRRDAARRCGSGCGRRWARASSRSTRSRRRTSARRRCASASALSMPLMLLGGINRRDTMEQAMAHGFDFVAMGRALLREPDLVNELAAGRPGRRRLHPLQPVHADHLLRHPLRRPRPGLTVCRSAVRSCRRIPDHPSSTSLQPEPPQPSGDLPKLERVLVCAPWVRSSPRSRCASSSGPRAPSAGTRSPGIDAHPDLELVGVWVSNPAKDGKDAGELAELGRELGHPGHHRPRRADRAGAGRDRAHRDGRRPGLRVHRGPVRRSSRPASTSPRSGPVLLQWPEKILPPEMIERLDDAGPAHAAPACTSTASTPASPTTCCRWR